MYVKQPQSNAQAPEECEINSGCTKLLRKSTSPFTVAAVRYEVTISIRIVYDISSRSITSHSHRNDAQSIKAQEHVRVDTKT